MKYSTFFLALIISAIFCQFGMGFSKKKESKQSELHSHVEKIVDGDTLVLTNGKTIRLIGVDCSENDEARKNDRDAYHYGVPKADYVKYGEQGIEFLESELVDKEVTVKVDSRHEAVEYQDYSGRILGYILKDGELYNKKLIEKGFCGLWSQIDFSKYEEFKSAQTKAKNEKTGMWERA